MRSFGFFGFWGQSHVLAPHRSYITFKLRCRAGEVTKDSPTPGLKTGRDWKGATPAAGSHTWPSPSSSFSPLSQVCLSLSIELIHPLSSWLLPFPPPPLAFAMSSVPP